jgi:steroid delta-isomerase-like uncharacterized protein
MSQENVAVVRRMVEDHWNGRNAGLVSELFAPNVLLQTPDGPIAGHEGALALLQTYHTAFPDFRIIIQELLDAGDQVVLQYRFTGTHRGPLAGFPPGGRQVNTPPGIAIIRVEGGKISGAQFAWDKYALLQQMGVLPMSAAAV